MQRQNARVVIEVAVDSVAGAMTAANAGADRLELCADLLEGGITPSLGLFTAVRDAVTIPVFAMLRPRGGDFLYADDEFDVMCRDATLLREHGAAGLVSGCLTADGELDRGRLARLRELAGSLAMTCHRAFDLCVDPHTALSTLQTLGIERVLTSGQAASAPAGHARIAEFVRATASDGPIILAGAGVRPDNAEALVASTGCRELHLSATTWRDSDMAFRRDGVPMGTATPPDEYSLRATDGDAVRAVRAAAEAAAPG